MGAPRRKTLIASRRRPGDDEEEEGSVAAGVEEDSSSEGSAISDADDDADAEGSDASDAATSKRSPVKRRNILEKHSDNTNGKFEEAAAGGKKSTFSTSTADTEAMMNGLKISSAATDVEEIHFDDLGQQADAAQPPKSPAQDQPLSERNESLIERRRREHEEYKKKRDADPAFVPNRGGFFMHDHRSAAPGHNGFRPSGRGRGRGRGGIGGPFSPVTQIPSSSNPADAPWAHDLHETVAQPSPTNANGLITKSFPSSGLPAKPSNQPMHTPPPNRSFSVTRQEGTRQIRVYMAGMQDPIIFSAVPSYVHTRLPHHRPPLRRDKPVRISLPNCPPRYIFPAMDRSFIFIPRALRPNQQGFGRGRGRGSFSGYGGYASRRTSAYGGSNYSPSVAMSRRSSLAREVQRDGLVSPAGSTMSRNQSIAMETGKPVVRLPPAADHGQQSLASNSPIPIVSLPQIPYPAPPNPILTESRPMSVQMHQPRPQKTVSVADIESPVTLNFNPPQQQMQQPFHHQVPPQVNGQGYTGDPNLFLHSRHPSHPSQRGTPLSQIPERAIHAQPFQPFPFQQPPAFYPHQYIGPPPVYFYPSPAPAMAPSVAAPAFVPGQQYPFVLSGPPPPVSPEATTQAGTVAHESNGMVYYYDSSQLTAGENPGAFGPVAYAPQNGYMIPQPAVYYPTQ